MVTTTIIDNMSERTQWLLDLAHSSELPSLYLPTNSALLACACYAVSVIISLLSSAVLASSTYLSLVYVSTYLGQREVQYSTN